MAAKRRSVLAGAEPLPPRRKWRAITIGTLLLVPAYWAVLSGIVSVALDRTQAPDAGPLMAFGLALLPFVFIALAFLSEHPRAPGAVIKAMVLAVLVGIPVSALAGDAVTGLVAGIGAGGIAAIRSDLDHTWKARAVAVGAATVFVFVMLRAAPEMAVLLAPILPFTSVGVADHLSERRQQQRSAGPAASGPVSRRGARSG